MENTKQKQSKVKSTKNLLDDFPKLEDMMFNNKNAIKNHKKKQNYKNKPK